MMLWTGHHHRRQQEQDRAGDWARTGVVYTMLLTGFGLMMGILAAVEWLR